MYIDSHCHYDLKMFTADRFEILRQVKAAGVEKLIIPSILPNNCAYVREKTDYVNYPNLLDEMQITPDELPQMFYAEGIHPTRVWKKNAGTNEEWEAHIRRVLEKGDVVAVGECGLDYHYDYMDDVMREKQFYWFDKQLMFADEFNLPLILHIRNADEDAIKMLDKYPHKRGGVVHCFGGNYETAMEYISRGFCLGIGGKIGIGDTADMKKMIAKVPLDTLLLETDAPYVTPECFDVTTRNTSLIIPWVAEQIAEIRGIPVSQVEEATTNNVVRVFDI